MIVWFSIAVAVGVAMGVIAATYLPWLRKHKGDTDRFFKTSGSHMKLYTPATLRLTLYLSLACVNFSDEKVKDWQVIEEHGKVVSEREYQRFKLGNAKQALITAVAFIDQALSRANRKREEKDSMTNPPIPPDEPQRLKTLG